MSSYISDELESSVTQQLQNAKMLKYKSVVGHCETVPLILSLYVSAYRPLFGVVGQIKLLSKFSEYQVGPPHTLKNRLKKMLIRHYTKNGRYFMQSL